MLQKNTLFSATLTRTQTTRRTHWIQKWRSTTQITPAWRIQLALTPSGIWQSIASAAFAWFLGSNDLLTSLVDPDTGSCRDGLHPDRANENRGAESVLSYLLALSEIRQSRTAANDMAFIASHAAG